MRLSRSVVASALVVTAAVVATTAFSQEKEGDAGAMMKKWAEFTRPGAAHERLAPLVGTFDTETTMWMSPGAPPTTTKGEAVGAWIFGKRFIELRSKGSMMGMPLEGLTILGYDNFRKRWTATALSSVETAQRMFEGCFDKPQGGSLHLYGTLDEYLDGTVAKNVRSTWRFDDADTIVHEVHDLDIGITSTKVFEVKFTRRK